MKRTLCLIFILLFLPVVSLATVDESSLVGVWIHSAETGDGDMILSAYHIYEKHVAYYTSQKYTSWKFVEEPVQHLCTWYVLDGKIFLKNEHDVSVSLYIVDDHKLSSDKNGEYDVYMKYLDYDHIVQSVDTPLCGKWSFYSDMSRMPSAIQNVLDYSLLCYDLYLFDNGAAYMTSVSIPKHESNPDFSSGALKGIWIGNKSDMTIQVAENTFKAKISDDGYLLLYMTKNLPLPFTYVDTADKFLELSK